MSQYRIKPTVVEARQVTECTKVQVLEGDQMARPGSWIVTHPSGLQRVVPNHLFADLYEPYQATELTIPDPIPPQPDAADAKRIFHKAPFSTGPVVRKKKTKKKTTSRR